MLRMTGVLLAGALIANSLLAGNTAGAAKPKPTPVTHAVIEELDAGVDLPGYFPVGGLPQLPTSYGRDPQLIHWRVTSTAGASCTLRVRYHPGNATPASFKDHTVVVPKGGRITDTQAPGWYIAQADGGGTFSARCTLGGLVASGAADFVVAHTVASFLNPSPGPVAPVRPTPKPSHPARPTPQPTPRPAATPTRTAIIGGHATIGNYTTYTDDIGELRVVGFLTNDGSVPITSLTIAVALKDDAGNTVAAETGIYMRSVVPPGERTPFLASFLNPPAAYATVDVKGNYRVYTAQYASIFNYASGLAIQDESAQPSGDQTGRFTVTGDIANNEDTNATLVEIIGVLYDAQGLPVDVQSTFATLSTILAGDSSPFSLDFRHSDGATGYKLYVQGRAG